MKNISGAFSLDSFFNDFSVCKQRFLILDYDGTLAPFCINRNKAFPYAGVMNIVNDIIETQTTNVSIVSGRAIQDLIPLLQMDILPDIWGSHGWEHLDLNGEYTIASIQENIQQVIKQVKTRIDALGLTDLCEQKPASLAVHWRGLQVKEINFIKKEVEALWQSITSCNDLEIHSFDGGLELRISGKNKGTSVQSIICNSNKTDKIAYLGDDTACSVFS